MNDEQLKCLFAAHFFKSLILAATILLPLLQPNDAPREVKRPQDNKTTGVKSITATSFSTTANANNAPTKPSWSPHFAVYFLSHSLFLP